MRTAVVQLVDLAGRGLVLVQERARGPVQGVRENLRLGVVEARGEVLEGRREGEELTEGVPAQVVLRLQLLHVLGGRAAGTGLEQAAAVHERHDRQHLRGGAQFQDGEQVREVVAQHVAGHRDGVLAAADPVDGELGGRHGGEDADVQPVRVLLREVRVHLLDQVAVVRAGLVQPEHRGHPGLAGAAHGQLHPVLDGGVLGLARTPDVTRLNVVGHEHVPGGVDHLHGTGLGDLEGLVVGAVLLGLLRHETHVRHGAHGGGVVRAVLAAVVDHGLVHTGVGGVRQHGQGVLLLALAAPHLARGADHRGHGGVHDHVRGHVQVGDALVRVHVGQLGAVVDGLLERGLDLGAVLEGVQAREDPGQSVVGGEPGLGQVRAVALHDVLEERADHVAEDDGVRDLHHGGLEVGGEQDALLLGAGHLGLQELVQGGGTHERGVHHLAGEHGHRLLEHGGLPVADQLDGEGVVRGHHHGLLVGAEVVVTQGGHVGLGVLGPRAHGVRVLLGVLLDGLGRPAVRVALAQHRVHGGALDSVVARADVLGLVRGGVLRVVRQVVAVRLQLLDGGLELRDGGGDVGKLHNVGFRGLRELTELREGVRDALLVREPVRELREDAGGQGDVPGLDLHPGGGRERLDHGLERVRGQHGRFVGLGVDDLGHGQ